MMVQAASTHTCSSVVWALVLGGVPDQ